ncbi:MAG: hypothetical protein ACXVCY_07265 [Pseudobdellovibrionaceae bacterium]
MRTILVFRTLFLFLILFNLSKGFSGELCGNDVCGPNQQCGVSADGKYQCVNSRITPSQSPPQIGTVSQAQGGAPVVNSSGGKGAGKKGIKGKNNGKNENVNNEDVAPSSSNSLPPGEATKIACKGDNNCPKGFHCYGEDKYDLTTTNGGTCVPDSSSSSDSQDSGKGTSACEQEFESLMQKCRTQITDTNNACDDKKDAGMNNALNGASQLGQVMGQAGGIQGSCSNTTAIMGGANAALAAFKMSCSSSVTSCDTVCNNAKNFAVSNNSCMTGLGATDYAGSTTLTEKADKAIEECNAFSAKVNEANQAIASFAQTLMGAANCQAASSGTGMPNLAVQKLCVSNPQYPGCAGAAAVDCTNPQIAATNKICICGKNPMDPSCSDQKLGGGPTAGPNIDPSTRASKADPSSLGGNLPDLPSPDLGNVKTTAGKPIDGKQGGNAALGGDSNNGAGNAPAKGGAGTSASEGPASSGSGFYGGSGSGMNGSNSSSSDGSNAARYAASAGIAGKNANPDLKKFLPGGQFDPKRGISGMTGPDGITGPHTDIWMKVQIRYQVTSPSLLP